MKPYTVYHPQTPATKAQQLSHIKHRAKYLILRSFVIVSLLISLSANASKVSWLELFGIIQGKPEHTQFINLHQLIEHASIRYQLPSSFIASIARIESNFDSCAISHKKAQGIMQLMTKTASSVGVIDPFDPVQGIQGGSSYLAQGYQKTRNLYLSAAYYNAGPKVLRLHTKQWPTETRKYMVKLQRTMKYYRGDGWKQYVPQKIKRTSYRICRSR